MRRSALGAIATLVSSCSLMGPPPPVITDTLEALEPPSSRPPAEQPAPEPIVTFRELLPRRLLGRASWYCSVTSACHYARSGGLYAAAGPRLRALLGRGWRGELVRVSSGARSVRVRLIDWCQCYKRTSAERVIDLYSDAFRRLAPLERGVIRVVIRP